MAEKLDVSQLEEWKPTNGESRPPDRGPLEHAFVQMFSLEEKFMSTLSFDGM